MQTLIGLHSLWRWVVLLVVVVALVRGVMGWLRGGAWTANDRTLVLVTTIVLDIQLLLGLAVYGMGQYWKSENSSTFIAYIHPLVMILAIVVAHTTAILIRRTEPASAKFRTLTIGLLVAIIMITGAIPPGTWSNFWVA
jgi:hypothetical protein